MTLSQGKQRGLRALANQRGVVAALAIDQRSALRTLFARASNRLAEEVPGELLVEFKEHVSRVLTQYASAILLDPEYGLKAAAQRHNGAGLLLAYEKTGYDKSIPGRLPSLLDGFSVARLKQAGADAIKVLLYYSPYSDVLINARKQAWVERVGAECLAKDLPFFLELVSYHDDINENSREFARIKPSIVIRAVEEFCKPRYAVDVLKVGVPVSMNFVESASVPRSLALHSREEAASYFRQASEAASLPFIYLSEGVSNETFADALEIAAMAGSAFSGVLCGRAIWQDAVPVFVERGRSALEDWLNEQGAHNIRNVNSHLIAARPWFDKFSSISSGAG